MRKTISVILFFSLFVWACGASAESGSQDSSGPITQEQAQKLYKKKCGLCHGKDGKKMLAGASNLAISELDMDQRVAIITHGKGKMTPFGQTLSKEEIVAVAEYLETLRK